MSFFAEQTSVVDLGGGNTVTIRKLTFGQAVEINSKAYKSGTFDIFQHGLERLVLSITAWEGSEFDGRPVSRKNIEALPSEVIRQVNDAIAKLNKDVDADEGNASGAATN